jgi:hypothetical protein
MATITSPGLMSGSDKATLQAVLSEVQAIQGKSYRLTAHAFTFASLSSDPDTYATQKAEIETYARAQLGLEAGDPIPDHTSVHNTNGGHLLRLNPTVPPKWVDDGLDVVSVATNTSQGIVKGSSDTGRVGVLSDGTMTVNGWVGKEDVANKVTEIGPVGSDTNYPSEKATATALAGKEDVGNKTSAVRDATVADNVRYPTEKAVATGLAVKEDAANKTDVVNAGSTDVQYPTAKAVNDAIVAHVPKGGAKAKLLSGSGERSADLAENANYTVPSYIVGDDQLVIYLNGYHCAVGQQYQEVGSEGTASVTIKLLHPLRIQDSNNVYVW